MRRTTLSLAALIVALAFASTAFASLNQFSGEWKNADPNTRGVTALEIRVMGANVTVHAWGQCQPQDCDWGQVNAYAYASSVSSNLAASAEAVSADFRTNFSQTLLVMRAVPGNRLRAEVFTHFTDNSGRTNYTDVYTFVRGAQAAGPLPAPMQISPTNGSVFSNFPRRTTLRWRPVRGAASYTVEIDCRDCCQAGKWCTEVGREWKVVPGLRTPIYTFDFVGAQSGRWRVWAVDEDGRPGVKSDWWEFRYTR